MTGTITTTEGSEKLSVMGEILRPLLTHAMGSEIEIFDTSGPPNAGPPTHFHLWEEIYVVISGELEVTVDGDTHVLRAGGMAHVPANAKHSYRNITNAHFLTIVSRGNATGFYTELSEKIGTTPPDVPSLIRVAESHGVKYVG
jgi:quercetin dioxygenase-like cupin family protein